MAKQDPVMISNELNLRSKDSPIPYLLDDNNKALIQNLNHIRDVGSPDAAVTDHIMAGEYLIRAGQKVIDAKNAETSALYKKLADANGGNLPMDGKTFVDSADAALNKNLRGYFVPKEIRSIMNEVKEHGMTFERF